MRYVATFVCALLLAGPVFAQQPAPAPEDLAKQVAALNERVATLVKTGAQKDAEIAKLKSGPPAPPDPATIETAIKTRVADFQKFKTSPVVRACTEAKGKALIGLDPKGVQLIYTGCIL